MNATARHFGAFAAVGGEAIAENAKQSMLLNRHDAKGAKFKTECETEYIFTTAAQRTQRIWESKEAMARVHVEPDCGNAPKKEFLRDFMIAFANGDTSFILDSVTDAVQWDMVGSQSAQGKADVEVMMREMMKTGVDEMTIGTIITHGNAGSVNGVNVLIDGSRYGFCHVCTFSGLGKNGKLKQISSYVIAVR